MEVRVDQLQDGVGVQDGISRKLRGAGSMLLMMCGDGQQVFSNMGDEWREAFIDTIIDLTEDALRLNDGHRR